MVIVVEEGADTSKVLWQDLGAEVDERTTYSLDAAHHLGFENIYGRIGPITGRIWRLLVELPHHSVCILDNDAGGLRLVGDERHHRDGRPRRTPGVQFEECLYVEPGQIVRMRDNERSILEKMPRAQYGASCSEETLFVTQRDPVSPARGGDEFTNSVRKVMGVDYDGFDACRQQEL